MKRKAISRRQLLRSAPKALGAALALWAVSSPAAKLLNAVSRGDQGVRWYEVVQDMKNTNRWHINLYTAKTLGDLEHGKLLSHRVVGTKEFLSMRQERKLPARFQFRDGQREQTF
jgi:hypothetical protein